jgi:DNA-directed RNA polymerase subunit RPC12/RpoP
VFKNRLEFKGAVIGMILGDASVSKARVENGNCYLSICHCQEQEEYLLYKKRVLEELTSTRFYQNQPNGLEDKYLRCRLDTKTHPLYTGLRDHLYYDGRKTVTEHAMKCLTALGLALWYMDDGCLTMHEKFDQPMLCTHGFNLAEHELMSRYLVKKFGIEWRIKKDARRYKGELKTYYCLMLRRKDREKFFDIIRPYVVDCMLYKITPKSDVIATRLGEKIDLKCLECGNSFQKDFKHRDDACRFCSKECYWKSKKHTKGTQIVSITEDGRGRDELGQFIKLSEDIVCSA